MIDAPSNHHVYPQAGFQTIGRAKLAATRQRRIAQMLAELERGDRYMKMAWHGARKQNDPQVKVGVRRRRANR
jgi:hypothetical protein